VTKATELTCQNLYFENGRCWKKHAHCSKWLWLRRKADAGQGDYKGARLGNRLTRVNLEAYSTL